MWLYGLNCMSSIQANKMHIFVSLKVWKHSRKKTKDKLYTEKENQMCFKHVKKFSFTFNKVLKLKLHRDSISYICWQWSLLNWCIEIRTILNF